MISPPPSPKKRRRWLIVAFVLVLVSLVSWWNWPRGDARFVGKWAWDLNPGYETWDLRSNGTAYLTKSKFMKGTGRTIWAEWKYDGTTLRLSSPWLAGSSLPVSWKTKFTRFTGQSYLDRQLVYRVESLNYDRLSLRRLDAGLQVTMARVAD